MSSIKAVILIGGPNKGQRFRPLSFNSPKHMFPVGGQTIVGHLIASCLKLEQLTEILLLGFYPSDDETLSDASLQGLVRKYAASDRSIKIRYFQEKIRSGTAGGMYQFRDKIKEGGPAAFFVLNGDVCGDFDLSALLAHHQNLRNSGKTAKITVMTTEADRSESLSYGCLVVNPSSHAIEHYVEKPKTFVSNVINCGIYVCSLDFLQLLETAMQHKLDELDASASPHSSSLNSSNNDDDVLSQLTACRDFLSLEINILQSRLAQQNCFSYRTQGSWWCQVKTASSAIYANGKYLCQYGKEPPHWFNKCLTSSGGGDDEEKRDFTIIGDVYIHPSAKVGPNSVIGPSVSIMDNSIIGPGVRIKNSIILKEAVVKSNTLIMYSIVDWNCVIGSWVRVEGTSGDPDPNNPFAKVANPPLYNSDGKLNPSISVLGCNVRVVNGTVIVNSIILPHKEIVRSHKNEIVL